MASFQWSIPLLAFLFIQCNTLTSKSIGGDHVFDIAIGKNAAKSEHTHGVSNGIELTLGPNQNSVFTGIIGLSLPESIGLPSLCDDAPPGGVCMAYGDYAKVVITPESGGSCERIEWTSDYARRLDDCYDIFPGLHWYGGGETYSQRWPIEVQSRDESPFITGDHLNNGSFFAGGVLEKYWLVSNGVGFFVDDDIPLHFSLKSDENKGQVCLTSKDDHPYTVRSPLTLKYSVCIADNILEAHKKVANNFFRKPNSIPAEQMLVKPLWSTWAQYHAAVNQSIVLDFSRRVVSEGFSESSHIEIDDNWESCYGEETFNQDKFPDAKAMVDEIKQMNLNVTVWVHPFVNFNCPLFQEGLNRGYFVKDVKGKTGLASWWAGSTAGAIDVTNPEAVEWWQNRLRRLQQETGVDSFKFDAGETNWLPYHPRAANGNNDLMPNLYTTKFVEAVSAFGGLIETRTAHRNHDKGIFIRMMDKDSSWSYGNGLRSMIPTLLHFGLLGYPFVLPDMIGGNAYGGRPSKELYVRWMQANVLMPAVQISIVPWDFDDETVELTKQVLTLRNALAAEILSAARQATVDGSPMNKPLWYLDPTDRETFTIDSEYTLGDDIIVAPILDEGATKRDVYLPRGDWVRYPNGEQVHQGPVWLRDYDVPINSIPIFIRNTASK